jgi:hypothetical protein
MYCPACGACGPADPDTGSNGDELCPNCKDEGWDEDMDGNVFNDRDERLRDAKEQHDLDVYLGK